MAEINRDIFPVLLREFNSRGLTLLLGSRYSGKSHLMKKLFHHFKKKGIKSSYFDLEVPQTSRLFNKTDAEILKMLIKDNELLFLDEFYLLKNPWPIFQALQSRGAPVKIFTSASSYYQISKQIDSKMVGKMRIFPILPCSFAEMSQVWQYESLFFYLKYGGLPGLSHCSNEQEVLYTLADIHQSYILKDVKSFIKNENIKAFNHLVYLLAAMQGKVISISGLARDIGSTSNSVNYYMNILCNTGVLFKIGTFFNNKGNELKRSYKYYMSDLGIRNMVIKDFRDARTREDAIALYENFVLLELQNKLDPISKIQFWRTKDGREVNFIYIHNRVPLPIFIQPVINHGEIPQPLHSFLQRYPDTKQAIILNLDKEDFSPLGNTLIIYRPFHKINEFKKWLVYA